MENGIDLFKALGAWAMVLINIGGFLIGLFLLWRSNKKDFEFIKYQLTIDKKSTDEKIDDVEKDIEKLWNKIDDNITPAIASLQTEIKKNCQAVRDLKDRCKDNHYGVMHSYQGKQ